MQWTPEQYEIIHSTGDIKINAVAGSGKTTTIIEYAKARPAGSRILYLAFNKTVKLEAKKKFEEKGMLGVQVETAHSLAFRKVVPGSHYSVRKQEYKSYEVAEILGLQGSGEKHAEFIIANHIQKFVAYFCNSDKARVQELNYLDVVTEPKAKTFVTAFYPYILAQARRLLAMMDRAEIEITHDFYLKKYQLSSPALNYDYILFDEGQDASPAMLDVFLKQAATKVIVGDVHQQIYSWRYAVNSLEKVSFRTYLLSTSFRFPQPIADLASSVLDWKHHLGKQQKVTINGKGVGAAGKTRAVIARTNLGLLLKAIEYVTERKTLEKIYFEGNIYSYTYADEGASLYDVLNLKYGRKAQVKDKLIQRMVNMNELKEYIEKTEDAQLGMMVEIVEEYGDAIPGIIQSLKDKHIADSDRDKADIVFSTVHRCKGMEYDEIQVVADFLTEEKIEKLVAEKVAPHKINEEINLLYVAVTRARQKVNIPTDLVPANLPPSPCIRVLQPLKVEKKEAINNKWSSARNSNTWPQPAVATTRISKISDGAQKGKQSLRAWSTEDDAQLVQLCRDGATVFAIAKALGRSTATVRARIKKPGFGDTL